MFTRVIRYAFHVGRKQAIVWRACQSREAKMEIEQTGVARTKLLGRLAFEHK